MIIQNHEIFTLETSFTKFQFIYIDGNLQKGGLKVMATSHTDGTQQVIIHHIDVAGSTTPFMELRLTMTVELEGILSQIHSGKERIKIQGTTFSCFAYLEELPQKTLTSGEATIRFSIEKFL